MKIFVILQILFILYLSFHIQESDSFMKYDHPELGTIIDTVRCKTNPKFSYALYLPNNYSDTVKWPLICIFDPAARGRLAITNFCQAAEKLGYILVCSNQSRNGMSENEYTEIANNLFTDIERRYPIDFKRIYTSGFSGGSRVATLIALNNKNISGVIACGAGFPKAVNPLNKPHFEYFGLIGSRDMNYDEMCGLEKELISWGVPVELRIFDGDHNWPSPDLLQEAMEWMELKAMEKGIMPKNSAFFDSQFEKYKNRADLLLKQGNLIESARYYEYAIKDFPNRTAANNLKETLDSLYKTKDYIKYEKEWNKTRSQELEIQNTLLLAFQSHVLMKSLPDSLRNWWGLQVKTLRNMENSRDLIKQTVASRQLNLLLSLCNETARNFINFKKYKPASICYQIESVILPENYEINYLLARVYALDNDPKNSLRSLEKAIKLGSSNRASIEKDTAFNTLLNEKRFMELLKQLKQKPD